jgi:hypothetical protein
MVVGRRVLGDFVSALCGGSELAKKQSSDEEEQKWAVTGKEVFDTEEGKVMRQEVVEGVLTPGGLAGWCEEQVPHPAGEGKVADEIDYCFEASASGVARSGRRLVGSCQSLCSDSFRGWIKVS